MSALRPTAEISHAKDVVSRVVAGEAILVDLKSGHYFGLDPVGSRIWELIAEKGTFGEVLAAMLAEFDVGEEQLRADLQRLLGELLERHLVTIADGPG